MAMKGFLISISICVLWFSGDLGAADNEATLDSLIKMALEKNPGLQAARDEYQSAVYSSRVSGTLPDPALSFGAINLPRTSLSLDETPMSGITVGLSQTIPWPSKLSLRGKIGNLKSELKLIEVAWLKSKLIHLVKESYYEYSYWTLALQIIDRNLGLTKSIISSAETRYSNGLGSAQDFLRGQTTYSRQENRRLEAELNKQKALLQLANLTGDFDIMAGELNAFLPDDIDSTSVPELVQIKNQCPEIIIASLNADLAEKNLALSKADYWPNLILGFEYRLRDKVPGDPLHGEDYLSARLGMSIPIWFFSKQRNSNRSARAGLQAARADRQAAELEAERLLADYKLELVTIQKRFNLFETAILPQAKAAFEAAQIGYEVGQIDFHALLTAQTELFEIELEMLEVVKKYNQKLAQLDELVGIRTEGEL